MFSIFKISLPKIECIIVLQYFEVLTLDDALYLKILWNRLITFQIINVLILLRNRKEACFLIDQFNGVFFFIFLCFFGGELILLILWLLLAFFEFFEDGTFIISVVHKSIGQMIENGALGNSRLWLKINIELLHLLLIFLRIGAP